MDFCESVFLPGSETMETRGNNDIVFSNLTRICSLDYGTRDAPTVLVRQYYRRLNESHVASQLLKNPSTVSTTQQRHYPRIRIQIPIFVRGIDAFGVGFIELTKTLNISSTGACITSSHLLQLEQVIQITIPTPSPSSDMVPHETPPISARVLRQESAGELKLFGLEFLRPLA